MPIYPIELSQKLNQLIMKIRILLLTVLMITAACGVDNIENLGRTDCAVIMENRLDDREDVYQDQLRQPDINGNQQSLEQCIQTRNFTSQYLLDLISLAYTNRGNSDCTGDERVEFGIRIEERINDLDQDMESTWNRCEEVYGGG